MNLTPPSQLLLRNIDRFEDGVSLINPPLDALLKHPNARIQAVYGYDARLTNCSGALPTEVGAQFLQPVPADTDYLLFWPKAKQQGVMMLENWLSLIASNRLYVIGENRSGLKSIAKPLAERGIQLRKVDSARHCLLMRVTTEVPLPPFKLADWSKEYQIALDGSASEVKSTRVSVVTLPGTFSHGALDAGTRLLLDHLPNLNASGKTLADIGCGAGVIAAFLAKRYPDAEIIASDINMLALAATSMTAQANQLSNLNVMPSDGLSEYSKYSLDCILTNPPFHEGLRTHYEVTETLLRQAPAYLKPSGKLILVANRFLDYEPILQEGFKRVQSLVEDQGFKVLLAEK